MFYRIILSSLSIINYLSINLHKRGLRHRPSTRLPASTLSHLCYFLQMPLHCTFVSLCNPKGLLSLLLLLCMYPDTENVFRKFLICQPGHPQFSWEHSICNPIVDIVFKMHFSWMIILVWISSFSDRRSRKQLLLLRNRLVVEFYFRSQLSNFFLRLLKLAEKFFNGYALKRSSEAWMSLILILWLRELTSHNSFLSSFFPLLFFHSTRPTWAVFFATSLSFLRGMAATMIQRCDGMM